MSEVRDWLKILSFIAIGLLVLWLLDKWLNHGEVFRLLVREMRSLF